VTITLTSLDSMNFFSVLFFKWEKLSSMQVQAQEVNST